MSAGRLPAVRGLIVSCQALEHEPLFGGGTMAQMARAAEQAGAIAIRTNGVDDIRRIKNVTALPVIGLIKRDVPGSAIFITPTLDEVEAIVEAGADIVALDVTLREERDVTARELIRYIHSCGRLAMADVSTLEEGWAADRMGVDYIGTTLSGYTPYSLQSEEPDLELVAQLKRRVRAGVIAEGRIWTPAQAAAALEAGADYVVVGSAITRPQLIAARFVEAVRAAADSTGGGESHG
ncbi:N-acetylmannosamine-6-phosphate 2-epimerase [Paenibacillus athensensis]|uniref:Putative N-acetylmannosamine-6-phosphate 2-epimerase n=1 Tax=Paenibacillus athensensis TaxID=1967502 RepID=A0A4Y8PTQ2_9BACL|nr:N-acetylmannosamine-6-phosphate 2-epimerase [Paenibacillus athensensis]MCD1261762.1 N-acetylmannosamine-6-phosphate 2-epimerase [Paenibacillus athensensis]